MVTNKYVVYVSGKNLRKWKNDALDTCMFWVTIISIFVQKKYNVQIYVADFKEKFQIFTTPS